jgi:hypothetical protein
MLFDMTVPPIDQPPPRRSTKKWFILFGAWCLGLLVWMGYIALLFVGFVRVFG